MASGIHSMLEDALSQGRAVAKRPDTSSPDIPNASQNEQQEEEDLTTARLSNAALLASSILAAHGNAEVSTYEHCLTPWVHHPCFQMYLMLEKRVQTLLKPPKACCNRCKCDATHCLSAVLSLCLCAVLSVKDTLHLWRSVACSLSVR